MSLRCAPVRLSLALTGLFLLVACSDSEGTPSAVSSASQAPPSHNTSAGSPLLQGLGRIGTDVAAESTYVEFADTNRLNALAAQDKDAWATVPMSIGALQQGIDFDTQLAIDLENADYVLSAGSPPSTITLIVDGQDGDAVRAAAEKAGYTGSEVLSQDLDLQNSMTVSIAQVLPMTTDVALGGRSADLLLVDADGDSLADTSGVSAVTGCLGDVVAATLYQFDAADPLVAVGVQENDGQVTSMMCVHTEDDAAATTLGDDIRTALASGDAGEGKTYAALFPDAEVTSTDDGVVQVTMPNATNTPPGTILAMAVQSRLPGVSAR